MLHLPIAEGNPIADLLQAPAFHLPDERGSRRIDVWAANAAERVPVDIGRDSDVEFQRSERYTIPVRRCDPISDPLVEIEQHRTEEIVLWK
jgi:hypothetical protein